MRKNNTYPDIIATFYNYGAIDLKEVFNLVKEEKITKEEFHSITGYSYNGLKESRRWI